MHIFTIDLEGTAGPLINGLEDGIWIERYRKGGEFQFTSKDPAILDALPLRSLVTHRKTPEVMIVENHEIEEERGKRPTIIISGRGLDEVLMENRRVTVNDPGEDNIGGISDSVGGDYLFGEIAIPGKGYVVNECVGAWKIALEMMQAYMVDGVESATYEPVTNLVVQSDYDFEEDNPDEWIDYNFDSLPTLFDTVQGLLEEKDLGIKVNRPSSTHSSMLMTIYKGRGDMDTDTPGNPNVYFSWLRGDIDKASYLWSTKSDMSALFIYDAEKTAKIFTDPIGNNGLNTKIGILDVAELNIDWDVEPYSEAELEVRGAKMRRKGRVYLRKQKPTQILDADVSRHTGLVFNNHYLMGDLIKIYGNYKLQALMRVVEHITSFDSKGERDYPVLEFPTA